MTRLEREADHPRTIGARDADIEAQRTEPEATNELVGANVRQFMASRECERHTLGQTPDFGHPMSGECVRRTPAPAGDRTEDVSDVERSGDLGVSR